LGLCMVMHACHFCKQAVFVCITQEVVCSMGRRELLCLV
jgi:hypothetical protein